MTDSTLRILILEDSVPDSDLATREIQLAGINGTTLRVDTEAAFLRALDEFQPQVILADNALASFDAKGALAAVRERRPGTPIIVFTGATDAETAAASIKAGAEDVILKNNLARLGPAIQAAVSARRPLARLTPRQFEVLRLLAQGHPTRDIARRLKLSVKTVETHRSQVFKRLDMKDVAGLVRYAVRVGLVSTEV